MNLWEGKWGGGRVGRGEWDDKEGRRNEKRRGGGEGKGGME